MITMLQNGDCLDEMRDLADGCVDAIVTDPPYGLAFMGAKWDNFGGKSCGNDSAEVRRQKAEEYAAKNSGAPRYANGHGGAPTLDAMRSFQSAMTPIFAEALRVAKPGAHLLAFGGTRTYHRLTCAIEDAGWEIRDCIMWVYGSGFPKGQNVGKQVEALLKHGKSGSRTLRQVEQEGSGTPYTVKATRNGLFGPLETWERKEWLPELDEAKMWDGWNTVLKPAFEPIVVARKPLDGTVAANVLKYGTGAINIDACRVPTEEVVVVHSPTHKTLLDSGHKDLGTWENTKGRFPANLIHDGSDEVVSLFPDTGKSTGGRTIKRSGGGNVGSGKKSEASWSNDDPGFGDSGSAARFFYCAKASRSERGEGNVHPTVKPIALMRYLVRLVTRKGGVVLDPFMGSGTTGIASIQEGMNFIGIEKDPHYYEIAQRRISQTKREPEGPIQLDLFA